MTRRRSPVLATLVCLCWLGLGSGFAVEAAAPSAPIDLGGQPVPGGDASTNPAEPTPIGPGLWQATLPGQFSQHFTYERRMRDSRVHIGVMGGPQGDDNDSIDIAAAVGQEGGEDYSTCSNDNDSGEFGMPQAVFGASIVVGVDDDKCREAGAINFEVSRNSSSTDDLPYVIKVVEEAPADDPEGEVTDEPAYDVPEPSSAKDEAGKASFDDAPSLDASSGAVTVKATVTEGTEVLWRVPVSWGELPVVRVDVPANESEDAPSFGGPSLSLNLIDPVRERLRYVDSSREHKATGDYSAATETEEGGAMLIAAGFPVTRDDARLPGDYWISLAVKPADADAQPVDVPVEVTVELQGDANDGPAYQKSVLAPDGEVDDDYSPDRPFLVADDTFEAVASGNPRATSEDSDGWFNGRRISGLALGVLSAACLAIGAVRLRARR